MKKWMYTCLGALMLQAGYAQTYHSNDLIPVAQFGEYMPIGVAVSSDNRVFVSFPKPENGPYQYALTEVIDGKTKPYPDAAWNLEGAPESHFVRVQDLCVDSQDNLWVLDSKPAPASSIFESGEQQPAGSGYFKLVKINLHSNQVEKIYTFDDLDKKRSGLNDLRVDTEKQLAYLSDPGLAALVVLDLNTGKSRVVLEKHVSTLGDPNLVLTYDGKQMRDASGRPFVSNVNGIALTKDNKYFYFKPINHLQLFRVKTSQLADPTLPEKELRNEVEYMGQTTVTHGLIADESGNVYLSSSMDYSIKYLTPHRGMRTLVQDSRILWPDSFGIGSDGYLYFSCPQLQRMPQWNDGKDERVLPYTLYKVKLPK